MSIDMTVDQLVLARCDWSTYRVYPVRSLERWNSEDFFRSLSRRLMDDVLLFNPFALQDKKAAPPYFSATRFCEQRSFSSAVARRRCSNSQRIQRNFSRAEGL